MPRRLEPATQRSGRDPRDGGSALAKRWGRIEPRKDKVALVTGASSGIGLAVVKEWIRRGGRAALVARTELALVRLARELGGDVARAYALDVTDLAALEKLPERVVADFGRLDVVVNNAGLNRRGSIARHEPLALGEVVTTNLTAPVVLTRAALPVIERGGAVVHVASLAGMVPVPGEATYSASKAGLRAFARAVADDFAEKDVHVGCVSPGPVDTGFLGDFSEVPDLVLSQPMSTAEGGGRARCSSASDSASTRSRYHALRPAGHGGLPAPRRRGAHPAAPRASRRTTPRRAPRQTLTREPSIHRRLASGLVMVSDRSRERAVAIV